MERAERWMTVFGVLTELAPYYGEELPSVQAIRAWCKRGVIPGAMRFPDGWRVPRSGFEQFLKTILVAPK